MEVSWTVAAVLAGQGWSQTPCCCCRFPVDTCQDWFHPPPFVLMLATGDPGHWSRRNTACHSPGHVTTSRWRQVARAGAGPGLPQSRHHPSPTGFIIKYHLIFNAASIFATATFRVCQTAFVACFSCQNPQFFGQPQQRKIVSQESSHVWLFLTY